MNCSQCLLKILYCSIVVSLCFSDHKVPNLKIPLVRHNTVTYLRYIYQQAVNNQVCETEYIHSSGWRKREIWIVIPTIKTKPWFQWIHLGLTFKNLWPRLLCCPCILWLLSNPILSSFNETLTTCTSEVPEFEDRDLNMATLGPQRASPVQSSFFWVEGASGALNLW